MTRAKEAICTSCGRSRVIVAKGLCKSCYNREYTAKNRPGNSQPADLAMDARFTCQRLHCRMAVKHCIAYQQRVLNTCWGSDALNVPYRESCIDCLQGKAIATAVENKDIEAIKALDPIQPMPPTPKVEQRLNLEASAVNEAPNMTPNSKEDDQTMTEAKLCVKCGSKPEVNPVSHLCAECHSEWVKSTRPKAKATIQQNLERNFGMDHWVGMVLSGWPDLQERIEALAKAELRTPEAQAVWMLKQAVEQSSEVRA